MQKKGGGFMETRDCEGYSVLIKERKIMQANGILEVESFDENVIIAISKLGPLVIKGEGLHIVQLNLEEGQLALEGLIDSIQYVEDKKAKFKTKGKGMMKRLFK